MELTGTFGKWAGWFQKYKYVLLLLAIGIVLMCIPGKSSKEPNGQTEILTKKEESMEQKLEQVLSQMQGAGKVRVMLTIAAGERIIYQYDEDTDHSDHGASDKKDTVIITDSGRNEEAVIAQILPPVYLGAVIICQGADQPSVKFAIVEAVSKATGLGADKICVIKMK